MFLYIKEHDNKNEPSKCPSIFTYVQKCMQWRKWQKWRKIASLWQFELDSKRGPLEIGDFGENRQTAGDNGEKRRTPLETGDLGENGNFGEMGENPQRAGDIQNVANIQIGCQKWPLQIM